MAKPLSIPPAKLGTSTANCSCYQLAWHDRRWTVEKAARGHFCEQTRPKGELQAIAEQLNNEHGRWTARPVAAKTSRL